MRFHPQEIDKENMGSTASLTSPLGSTLGQAQESPSTRFDYITHHCGLQVGDLQIRGPLSKYSSWTAEIVGEEANPSLDIARDEQLLEKAWQKLSHPNFTKNWGYLNPSAAPILSVGSAYQVYITRPNFEQFKTVLTFVASARSVLVKYARLQSLENRNDTVVAYTADANDVSRICAAVGDAAGSDEAGALPGFATLSQGNLSMSRLRFLSDVESNGQRWQRLIENAMGDPQRIEELSRLARAEFIHLSQLLRNGERA